MKKFGIRILTVLSAVGLALPAMAFTNPTPTPSQQNTPQYITPGTGGNAAQSGRNTSNAQLIGAAVNIGAAAMYMTICTQAYCTGCWACPLVGLASAASSLLNSASGQSGAAGLEMSGYNPMIYNPSVGGTGGSGQDPWGNPIGEEGSNNGSGSGSGVGANGTVPGLPPGTTPQTIARDIARIRTELEKSGVKMSPDGKKMTTPDGRTFDLSKGGGGSMQDLMAMGLTQAEAASAMSAGRNYAKKAEEKFKQMSQLAGAGAGGGGGGRGIAAEGGGGGDPFAGFDPYGRDRNARNRKKAQVSGLTKKLGSDTIGVAGDDIFEMVTRRYKARDQQNDFLKD